jgi:hypothetical protein
MNFKTIDSILMNTMTWSDDCTIPVRHHCGKEVEVEIRKLALHAALLFNACSLFYCVLDPFVDTVARFKS